MRKISAMKHIVDIETWKRRDNYAFFRNFLNSWISVATEVDCTEARAAAKATGRSFFLYYLYAVLRSVNEIEEFRYRTDSSGNVVYHDRVDVITPIASRDARSTPSASPITPSSTGSTPGRAPSSPAFLPTGILTGRKKCCRHRATTMSSS